MIDGAVSKNILEAMQRIEAQEFMIGEIFPEEQKNKGGSKVRFQDDINNSRKDVEKNAILGGFAEFSGRQITDISEV
jgi:hypothetical protein